MKSALAWPLPLAGTKRKYPNFSSELNNGGGAGRVLYLSFSPFAVKGVLSIKYFRYYICINIKEGGLITYLSRCSKLNNLITINLRLYFISAEILVGDQMWWALKLIIFEIWWVKTQVNELLKTFLRRCRYIYLENIYALCI